MKILHILDHSIPLQSGYASRTRAIVQAQRARGWTTAHVTSAKHPSHEQEEEVEDLHFYRSPGLSSRLLQIPVWNQWAVVSTLRARIDEVIRRERPDILHAHSPALTGIAALAASRRHQLPLVYECRAFWEDAAVDHGTHREGDWRYRAVKHFETQVFRKVNAVTTICEGLRQDIVARGIPSSKVTVIPNAVDVSLFREQAAGKRAGRLRRELGLEGNLVLGFIGSFYAYEGLELLLRSVQRLVAHLPELKVLLVGGGAGEMALRERAVALRVADHVVFTGRIPFERVREFYDVVDILVYPRRSMRLTELVTPLKPLEAMAQGKLVVASDVGGHRELIREGENGFLFSADSVSALSETLVRVAESRDVWPQVAARARSFVERERSWPVSVAGYEGVYASASGT